MNITVKIEDIITSLISLKTVSSSAASRVIPAPAVLAWDGDSSAMSSAAQMFTESLSSEDMPRSAHTLRTELTYQEQQFQVNIVVYPAMFSPRLATIAEMSGLTLHKAMLAIQGRYIDTASPVAEVNGGVLPADGEFYTWAPRVNSDPLVKVITNNSDNAQL